MIRYSYLSGGFERLLKTMICLNFQEKNGELPNRSELLNRHSGHDIVYFKSRIEELSTPIDRPSAAMDYEVITEDVVINSICKLLSLYGQKSRYFNLDVVLGKEQEIDSRKEWENIENTLLKQHYGEHKFLELTNTSVGLAVIYEKAHQLITAKIELFLRAVTRRFIFGNFASNSKEYMIEIEVFSGILDNQLGKTDYRKFMPYEFIRRSK